MTAAERLKAIRVRAERSTPGPWKAPLPGFQITAPHEDYDPESGFYRVVIQGEITRDDLQDVRDAIEDDGSYYTAVSYADLGFIAAARTDVPDLVKCLEAVMAQCNPEINAIINRELGGEA